VYMELLFRKGVRDEYRKEALTALAKLQKKTELTVLMEAVKTQDEAASLQDDSVVFDLIRLLTDRNAKDLGTVRGDLEQLAAKARLPVTRQLGYVAMIAADGHVDKAWTLGTKSVGALQDIVSAMPLIRDPGLRTELYPKVLPLLKGLPKDLQDSVSKGKIVTGRYVRIEISGKKKTLTLAEVEVIAEDGRNVARP